MASFSVELGFLFLFAFIFSVMPWVCLATCTPVLRKQTARLPASFLGLAQRLRQTVCPAWFGHDTLAWTRLPLRSLATLCLLVLQGPVAAQPHALRVFTVAPVSSRDLPSL